MSMMQDFATNVEAVLLSLGWTEVVTDIEKMTVRAIFSAPGAAEQELVLKAGGYKKTLAEFGGPDLYPKVEEYDYQEFRAKMVEANPELEAMIAEERELNRAEELVAPYEPITQMALKSAVAESAEKLGEKEWLSQAKTQRARILARELVQNTGNPYSDMHEAEMQDSELADLVEVELGRIETEGESAMQAKADELEVKSILGVECRAEQAAEEFEFRYCAPVREESVVEKAHLERNEAGSFQPDGDEPVTDVPAGNSSNRGLIEQAMHDPHLAVAAVRDLEDAVSALGQPLVSLPKMKEDPMDHNDLVLMSMKNLNVMAKRLGLKKCSKMNKMVLIEAIAGALGLPSTLPVPEPEREDVKEQMAAANTEMLDRPVPPVEDGLPDLGDFVEVAVLKGAHKIRVGQSVHLVSTEDGRIAIKGVRFELKCVLNEKEMRFSNRTIVPAKWDNWLVRAIFAR